MLYFIQIFGQLILYQKNFALLNRNFNNFPLNITVNSGMSRPPKPVVQAKRVAPPAVPDVYRHSGSSFGSAGYGSSEDTGGFLMPPDTPNALGIRGRKAV